MVCTVLPLATSITRTGSLSLPTTNSTDTAARVPSGETAKEQSLYETPSISCFQSSSPPSASKQPMTPSSTTSTSSPANSTAAYTVEEDILVPSCPSTSIRFTMLPVTDSRTSRKASSVNTASRPSPLVEKAASRPRSARPVWE